MFKILFHFFALDKKKSRRFEPATKLQTQLSRRSLIGMLNKYHNSIKLDDCGHFGAILEANG